ncbi:homeobox-leucine zipper protein ATHB-52 [Salvia miltiorrhiza]|uniref:homeobox-leucine zipper protein ATHB-52 n=1 Tax=Salvia miltiorrhiza TaxID=226208 RepID=UPI0025AD6C62|nr:homeobox-leucine zipper protein ATHB-52 [Salvia miltiorrhiza]
MDDQFPYPTIRKQQQIKHKKRLSEEQVRLLESNFNFNNKLDPEHKSRLALELGVPPRQVAIWYQNKRARNRIQGLEVDHKALQLQLDTVLADNSRLKEEVQRLRLELTRASFASPSSGDEASNLVSRDNLERDLYASLVGAGGPFGAPDGYDFFG